MVLADGLNIIFSVVSSILNVLLQVNVFGVPLGVFIVGAFVVGCIMQFVFDIDSGKGGGDKQ